MSAETIESIASITYTGSVFTDGITSSPWSCAMCSVVGHGSIPHKPQYNLEVLEPSNVDAARYRLGAGHFIKFKMRTIVPAATFREAVVIAREHEMIKGDLVSVYTANDGQTRSCAVVDVSSYASAARVLGAEAATAAGEVGVGGGALVESRASVDTEWTLQVVAS